MNLEDRDSSLFKVIIFFLLLIFQIEGKKKEMVLEGHSNVDRHETSTFLLPYIAF